MQLPGKQLRPALRQLIRGGTTRPQPMITKEEEHMFIITRIYALAENICTWVSVVSLLAIMILTSFDVFARKIFDYSIPSLFEFTEDYLMVALVFLSLSYVQKMDGHIRVTLLVRFIPRVLRKPLDVVLNLAALILFLLIMVRGWENAVSAFQFGEVSASVLAYPLGPALLLVPIGCALLCVRLVHLTILSFTGKSIPA